MGGIPTVARSAFLTLREVILFLLPKVSKEHLVSEIKKKKIANRYKQVSIAIEKTNNKSGAPEWKYDCPAVKT